MTFAKLTFVPKQIEITIPGNQPLFFELKELFADIEPNENGEKKLMVNEHKFPEYLKHIIRLTTITVDLKDTYYKYKNKNEIECDEGGMPISHTNIPVFTLRTKLNEESEDFMNPIGSPEEIKNNHLKKKYI